MNLPTPFILYPALRLLLVNRLQKSINFAEANSLQPPQSCAKRIISTEAVEIPLWADLAVKPNYFFDVPLNQIHAEAQIEYVSALAFKLAPIQSLSTLAVAEQIQTHLTHQAQFVLSNTVTEQIWQNFIITVVEPGWIHLRLTNFGLAQWLQWAIDFPWQTSRPTDVTDTAIVQPLQPHGTAIFEILHAYARCNSLLSLGKQEKIMPFEVEGEPEVKSEKLDKLDKSEKLDKSDKLEKLDKLSQPIPWLTPDRSFRACQSQDWALIRQLCEAIDYLAVSVSAAQPNSSSAVRQLVQQSIRQSVKVAHRLSQAFQDFHAACRIWGMDGQSLPLAQVRLGLVLLTRKVLQSLIETRLYLTAYSAL